MKTYLDCYPCLIKQALTAIYAAGVSEEQQFPILNQIFSVMQSLQPGLSPPEIGNRLQDVVRQHVGVFDSYRDAKVRSTSEALELYPQLKEMVAQREDPFDTAIRLSIAGNIIDLAFHQDYGDLWSTVKRVLELPYAINATAKLRLFLKKADWILFLADNAGETVFDRVLVETFDVPVVYAVKEQPVVNDAIWEDAVSAGLDGCAQLTTTGSGGAGTILDQCSPEFRQLFTQAPVIIAKGQANYETLSEAGSRVFCLLQIKCPVIGRDIGAPVGSIVVYQSLSDKDIFD
jgi:uncharacterized protein with ATP-grasp and redox domains